MFNNVKKIFLQSGQNACTKWKLYFPQIWQNAWRICWRNLGWQTGELAKHERPQSCRGQNEGSVTFLSRRILPSPYTATVYRAHGNLCPSDAVSFGEMKLRVNLSLTVRGIGFKLKTRLGLVVNVFNELESDDQDIMPRYLNYSITYSQAWSYNASKWF